jgi:hypothetical protein
MWRVRVADPDSEAM